MPLTDASALLTQFASQLAACAAWTTAVGSGNESARIHYPSVAWSSATLPCAVISEDQRGSRIYATNAQGLRSGMLKVEVYSAGTVGAVEQLGQALLEQLLAQQSGIVFRTGYVGLCGDATIAEIAAQNEVRAIEINIEYGLEA